VTKKQRHEGKPEKEVITAQVSLYPLRQESIGPAVHEAVRALREWGLDTRVGEMSTLVWGEERAVFQGLQEAFHRATEHGDTVMAVTISNACPEPGRETSPYLTEG
jgi:uncharacterized protein YqgV (UPF0045/DUF77 family)